MFAAQCALVLVFGLAQAHEAASKLAGVLAPAGQRAVRLLAGFSAVRAPLPPAPMLRAPMPAPVVVAVAPAPPAAPQAACRLVVQYGPTAAQVALIRAAALRHVDMAKLAREIALAQKARGLVLARLPQPPDVRF